LLFWLFPWNFTVNINVNSATVDATRIPYCIASLGELVVHRTLFVSLLLAYFKHVTLMCELGFLCSFAQSILNAIEGFIRAAGRFYRWQVFRAAFCDLKICSYLLPLKASLRFIGLVENLFTFPNSY